MSKINDFVIEECLKHGVQGPDIPVYAQETFAQCSEDIIVISILRALALRKKYNLCDKRYLEIGANHPIATSATYLMHTTLQMRGVLVEANSKLLPALQKIRPNDIIKYAAISVTDEPFINFYVSNQNELSSLHRDFVEEWQDGTVGLSHIDKVPALRVNDLLVSEFQNEAPIYVSIDVEGLDFEILKDWNWARWRPAVIQVEPSDHYIKNNSTAIIEYLETQGYLIIAKTNVNLIAIDNQCLEETNSLIKHLNVLQENLHGNFHQLGDKTSQYKYDRLQTQENTHRYEIIESILQALPIQLRSLETFWKIKSGEVVWWKLALRQPWNITTWQTARRLQRNLKNK